MEFQTFYDYFLHTKEWAYLLMFLTLPLYVLFWNLFLYRPGNDKRKRRRSRSKVVR